METQLVADRFDEEVRSHQRGSGRRTHASLQSRSSAASSGSVESAESGSIPRQKSLGRRASRRSAQMQASEEAASLVMPVRKSRSAEGLAEIAGRGSEPADELSSKEREKKTHAHTRRARQRRIRAERDLKHDNLIEGSASGRMSDPFDTRRSGPAAREAAVAALAEEEDRAAPKGFPDAELKLSFASIKKRLRKSLDEACQASAEDGSEQLRGKSNAVEDADDVRKSEPFWLELRSKVFGTDVAAARAFVAEQRAKLPGLVERVLSFHVGPGDDQDQRVDQLLAEVAEAHELYHTHEKLLAGCREWRLNVVPLDARVHDLSVWKRVGSQLRGFVAACMSTFKPLADDYAGWLGVLAPGRCNHATVLLFYRRWSAIIIEAVSDSERGICDRREQCREMGLSDLGPDVGRSVLMLLRLVNALALRDDAEAENVGELLEHVKKMLRFVFETKVSTWSKLLVKNNEFVGLMRRLFARYFRLIGHEKGRLRRRVQLETLHTFLLERRVQAFDQEWQFATEMKSELRDLLGDGEEIFAMGFLEASTSILSDGLEAVKELGVRAEAGALSPAVLSSVQNLLVDDLEFCKRVSGHVHLSAIYEVLELEPLRRGLLESGHRIFRLPQPSRSVEPSPYAMDRVDSRDGLAVVLAVPAHMVDNLRDITMLLQAWCSTNDDIGGHVLVLEDDGGWGELEVLDTHALFGLVPGQGLDSSMDFGMRHGCLQIVAASVFALQRQRKEFEAISCRSTAGAESAAPPASQPASDFCRVVAEQDATFKAARELLENIHAQTLKIAIHLLEEVAEMDGLWAEEDEPRCLLAFRYAEQASKLFLNFQQISSLDRASQDAMENYDTQRKKRSSDPDGLTRPEHWFSARQVDSPAQEHPPSLKRFLSNANAQVFGKPRAASDVSPRSPNRGVSSPKLDTEFNLEELVRASAESPPASSSPNSLARAGRSMSERSPASKWGSALASERGPVPAPEPEPEPEPEPPNLEPEPEPKTEADLARQARMVLLEPSRAPVPDGLEFISPPTSPSSGTTDSAAAVQQWAASMQKLVEACTARNSSTAALGALASSAVQTAGADWATNLRGVLRKHGWQGSGAGEWKEMHSEDSRARLADDLGVLFSSFAEPGKSSDDDASTTAEGNGAQLRRVGSRPKGRGPAVATENANPDGKPAVPGLVRQNSPFVQTRAERNLSRLDSDPLAVRDKKMRQDKLIGLVVDKSAIPAPDPGATRPAGMMGSIQRQKAPSVAGPIAGIHNYLRHGRITVFYSSRTHLQSMLDDNEYVRSTLQRVAIETDTTCFDIDVSPDRQLELRTLFKPQGKWPTKGSANEAAYMLPQVYFGTKWVGGASAIRKLEERGPTVLSDMVDASEAVDARPFIEIPFSAIELTMQNDRSGHARPVRLGNGKSGQVWKARWQDYRCAVKSFQVNTDEDEAEFHAEMGMLQMLRHPHILNFYGAVTSGSHPRLGTARCIIMELCDTSLYQLLKAHGPRLKDGKAALTLRYRVGTCLLGAAKGMAFLHSKKIIHRDLKSANLLLTTLKSGGRTVVCDFALSRMSGHALTDAGLGTPGWIAPEAWLGDPVSLPSDVYGFAMVMYEVLTSTLPLASFDAQSEGQLSAIQYRICAENVRPPVDLEERARFFGGAAGAESMMALVSEYTELMEACWQRLPRARPLFPAIVSRLEKLHKQLPTVT